MSKTAGSGWKIALAWGTWTALVEFGLGRATGGSWSELLADHDVAHGRYLSFVLSSVFIAPLLWSWVLTGVNDGINKLETAEAWSFKTRG